MQRYSIQFNSESRNIFKHTICPQEDAEQFFQDLSSRVPKKWCALSASQVGIFMSTSTSPGHGDIHLGAEGIRQIYNMVCEKIRNSCNFPQVDFCTSFLNYMLFNIVG